MGSARAAELRSRSLGTGLALGMNHPLLSKGLRGWGWDLAACSGQQVISSLSWRDLGWDPTSENAFKNVCQVGALLGKHVLSFLGSPKTNSTMKWQRAWRRC